MDTFDISFVFDVYHVKLAFFSETEGRLFRQVMVANPPKDYTLLMICPAIQPNPLPGIPTPGSHLCIYEELASPLQNNKCLHVVIGGIIFIQAHLYILPRYKD